MGIHLKKINKPKLSAEPRVPNDGQIDLDGFSSIIKRKEFHFSDHHKIEYIRFDEVRRLRYRWVWMSEFQERAA